MAVLQGDSAVAPTLPHWKLCPSCHLSASRLFTRHACTLTITGYHIALLTLKQVIAPNSLKAFLPTAWSWAKTYLPAPLVATVTIDFAGNFHLLTLFPPHMYKRCYNVCSEWAHTTMGWWYFWWGKNTNSGWTHFILWPLAAVECWIGGTGGSVVSLVPRLHSPAGTANIVWNTAGEWTREWGWRLVSYQTLSAVREEEGVVLVC